MTTGTRILIIEDDTDIRYTLREALEAEGFLISEARDAEEGFAQLARSDLEPAIRLIILDNQMSGMGGQAFLKERLSRAPLLAIPVISVSATPWDPGPEFQVAVRLKKPFALEELIEAVQAALSP